MTKQEIDEIINDIRMPGEADYRAQMEAGDCRAFLDGAIRQGDLTSFDGARLRYYYALPKAPRANIVLVHGLCEFFEKYAEFIWTLYRAGFAVFFLEQRGHGQSEGKLPEPDADLVYIDSYDTYIKDQEMFLLSAVNHFGEGRKNLIVGHSMGGAIAALLLENVPGYFSAAAFCSPMFRLRRLGDSLPVTCGLHIFAKASGKMKHIAPGETHFPERPSFRTSSAKSLARYQYVLDLRRADRNKQTFGVTYGWVIESLKACRRLRKEAGKIKLPAALFSAGKDRLVDPSAYNDFCEKLPQCARFHYPAAGHEIYNADDLTRKAFYTELLRFLLAQS